MSLRHANQSLTLHDGFKLAQGTRIAFPCLSVHLDPDNYKQPKEFLPFRFAGTGPCDCDSSGQPKDVGRTKADALDEKFLPFGYGKQACPGRFFALKVVKLILGRFINEYDIEPAGTLPPSPISGSMEGFFLPVKKFDIRVKSRAF